METFYLRKYACRQARVIGTSVTLRKALMMTVYKGLVIGLRKQTTTKALLMCLINIGDILFLVGCGSWSSFFLCHVNLLVLKILSILSSQEVSGRTESNLPGSIQLAIALVVAPHPGVWAVSSDIRLLTPLYKARQHLKYNVGPIPSRPG
ncbi:hypothetical protein DKX38_002401 [Salix brachista]|uniref:Uncharacterized protein n=1 Tax=Salix brachista TaxID=2182728 RepID=A0A5N5NNV5_9ROSI|nr:hypothetical protein DKX38_002401 [Salix brachista]